MTEHDWVSESIATFIAGGLNAAEVERVETHLRICPDCTSALAEARVWDEQLQNLFASVRPGPALEDRMIRALPLTHTITTLRKSKWRTQVIKTVAASIGFIAIGMTGLVVTKYAKLGELPFPGSNSFAQNANERDIETSIMGALITDGEYTTIGKVTPLSRADSGSDGSDPERPNLGHADEIRLGLEKAMQGSDMAGMTYGKQPAPQPSDRSRYYDAKLSDDTRSMQRGEGKPAASPAEPYAPNNHTVMGQNAAPYGFAYTPPSGGTGGLGVNNGNLGGGAPGGISGNGGMPTTGGGFGGGISGNGQGVTLGKPVSPSFGKPATDGEVLFARSGKESESRATGKDTNGRGTVEPNKPWVVGLQADAPKPALPALGVQDEKSGKDYAIAEHGKVSERLAEQDNKMRFSEQNKDAVGDETLGRLRPTDQVIPPVPTKRSIPLAQPEPVEAKIREATPELAPVQPPADPKAKVPTPGAPTPTTPATPTAPAASPVPAATEIKKIIIRTGDIEFEIDSFDSAVATVLKLISPIKGAYVGTVNSEKLANGKMKGSVVVRIPPESLDAFVLDLRKDLGKVGELKGQRIGSQDITKQYTDLESRLKAARTMETRLLNIIKEGKGEIKQLLEAEKELGVWRTRIEEYEGELRYYSNQAALSTLTITLTEKEIRAAVGITETERVQAGIEVEDVDKGLQQAIQAVTEMKGRITKSELRQLNAGQFTANLQFEVPPETSGPMRDRLRQLGRVARLEIDRVTQTDGGSAPKDAKTKKGDSVYIVQLYNLIAVPARESTTVQVAVNDVPTTYRTLQDAVSQAKGRVLTARLDETEQQNFAAQFDFEVRRAEEAKVLAVINASGEVLRRNVNRAAENDNVTDSKVMYRISFLNAAKVPAREATTLQIAVVDVPTAYKQLQDAVTQAKGRVLSAKLDENDRQNITAAYDFEVRRADEAAVLAAINSGGEVLRRSVTRAGENQGLTDAKVMYRTTMMSASQLPARETTTMSLEVADVENTATVIAAMIGDAKGRQVSVNISHNPNSTITGRLVYDVPLASAAGLVERLKSSGKILVTQSTRNPNATDGKFATARLDITLNNLAPIVADDNGIGPQVRKGLMYSASALLMSLSWVVVGLCVVLPWTVVGFFATRLLRRLYRSSSTDTTATTPTTPTASTTSTPNA